MQVNHLYRSSTFNIPTDWSHFGLFILLGICLLIISASIAKVRIGSFPVNPLYWHYWVIAKAEVSQLKNDNSSPKAMRSYVLFLIGSICFFVQALFILIAILFTS